ncbi:MAG: hypothetical protein KC422_26215, partial [Trueperaceae bacterium]|nr:hypothetical protein [Trueperaceae bacterium]
LGAADIQVRRISAWKGEPHITSTYRLDLAGRLVSDLIYSLPKGAKEVHINAALELNDTPILPPAVGYFQRLIAQGKKLEARTATVTDLLPFANLVIETGSAVIRAEYEPGSKVLADLSVLSSVVAVKSHLLNIPDLPSLAGLVVEVGDKVLAGQLIARYVDDSVLELSEADYKDAILRLEEAEKDLALEQTAYEMRLKSLEQKIETGKDKVTRLRYLVERNAEPKNNLLDAETRLKELEQDLLLEQTIWTSKRSNLETNIRMANITIQKSEQQKTQSLDKQWVKAPITGLISDIRLTDVSIHGVTLEIIILEQDTMTN